MSLGGGSSGNPQGSTQSTQKAEPWSAQAPYLEAGFGRAANLFNSGGPQYYPGQTMAAPNAAQSTALYNQANIAGQGSPLTPAVTNATMRTLDPSFLNANPGNAMFGNLAQSANRNPGNAIYRGLANGPQMQGAINSAVQQATPGLLDTFTRGNRLSSPGAAFAVSQGLGQAAAPYLLHGQQAAAQGLSQNYATGLGAKQAAAAGVSGNFGQAAQQQNQAALMAPQLQQMPYNDLSKLYQAGEQQQGLQQQGINDQMARFNFNQTQPYNLLDWYNSSVGGNFGGTSTLTSPYFMPQRGGVSGALSGGFGGAALGSMFGMPMVGAGVGGLLGGIL